MLRQPYTAVSLLAHDVQIARCARDRKRERGEGGERMMVMTLTADAEAGRADQGGGGLAAGLVAQREGRIRIERRESGAATRPDRLVRKSGNLRVRRRTLLQLSGLPASA